VSFDPWGLDPEGLDPKDLDPRVLDPRVLDPNVLDPNVLDPYVLDPNVLDPNVLDPDPFVGNSVLTCGHRKGNRGGNDTTRRFKHVYPRSELCFACACVSLRPASRCPGCMLATSCV